MPKYCVALVFQGSSARLPPPPVRVASDGKQDGSHRTLGGALGATSRSVLSMWGDPFSDSEALHLPMPRGSGRGAVSASNTRTDSRRIFKLGGWVGHATRHV